MINAINSSTTSTSSDALTAASSSSTSTTSSSTAGSNSILGKDDFLKMLIAQMKNQDPMNPMDSTQYAAQLAQFSSLEQLQNLNTSMTQSINANLALAQSVNNTMASTLIGKEVKVNGNTITNNGQTSADIGYNLPSNAQSVSIGIYDSNGNLVKTIDSAPTDAGDHKLSWDFTDNNGSTVSNGDYTFKVNATDTSGNDITASTYGLGTINAIDFTSSGTMLVVGNTQYNLSDVQEIFNSSGGN